MSVNIRPADDCEPLRKRSSEELEALCRDCPVRRILEERAAAWDRLIAAVKCEHQEEDE